MITLYNSQETDFTHNGMGILSDCISSKIHRELNGNFYLELEYPLYDKKNLYLELQEHRIIKAPTPSGNQLFRIQRTEKNMSTIFVYAIHILFDLKDNLIVDTNIVGKTRLEAVQQLLSNTMNPHSFTVTGDATTYQDTARIVRYNPLKAIFGTEDNTILNRWGGEIDVDNFNIIVKDSIGVDTQELISYGKNLTGIRETLDMDTVATRIIPQGAEGLLLPEYYIDSPNVGAYYQPIIRHMTFDNIKVDNNTSNEQAYQMLRDVVQKLFYEKHIDEPFFNYEVEFIHLGDTNEYKQFKSLNKLNLGDRLKIRHQKLNIDLNGRIIAYDYNAITKKYIKIQLGTIKKNINMVINQTLAEVKFVKEKVEIEIKSLDEKLSSKIEVTERNINLSVSDLTDRVESAELKITPDAITSTVRTSTDYINDLGTLDGRLSTAESTITQQSNLIATKVDVDGVKSTIEQNPNSVKIGFNDISNIIDIDSNGIQVNHTDGSYSKLEAGGIKKYTAGVGKTYHYLTYTGSAITIGNTSDSVRVQLPDEFKGKDFDAITFLRDTNNDSSAVWERLLKITCFISAIDRTNATIDIIGYAYYSDDWSNLFNKPIQVGFVITA